MKPLIFKDHEAQAQFERDGYVVIDFISAADAKAIADKFYELNPVVPKGFYSNAYNPDEKVRAQILAHTDKIIQKALDEKLKNYKKLGSTFLCKAPGEEGKVSVHQDWTVVDESKFFSATIWVPTVNVNDNNGALRVIPGSHLFFNNYRSPNIEFCYKSNEELLWANMVTIPMKAGQAFILNHAVIHGSAPNKTTRERLVIAYGVAPKEAPLLFYHKDRNEKNDRVEKFEMPDDFFLQYCNLGDRPHFGKSVATLEYPIQKADSRQLRMLIKQEKEKREMLNTLQGEWAKKGFAEPPTTIHETGTYQGTNEKDFWEKLSILKIAREFGKRLFR